MKTFLLLVALSGVFAHTASAEKMFGVTSTNALVSFDSATPQSIGTPVAIAGLQTGENVAGIDFRPRTGELFLVGVTTGAGTDAIRLYTLDPATGTATLVPGSISFNVSSGTAYGVDFNPTVDRIRVVNNADENFRINPNNGARADAPTNDTDLSPAGSSIDAIAYDRNFDTGLAVANRTTLYAISRATSQLVTVGGINQSPSPNGGAVQNARGLGVTIAADSVIALDIPPSSAGAGLAAWKTADAVTRLYSVSLLSGAATAIGPIGNGTLQITSLAAAPLTRIAFGPEGKKNRVQVFDTAAPRFEQTFVNSAALLNGGVRVAVGDYNSDGVPDIVTGSGKGAPPLVQVFDGRLGTVLASYSVFEPSFKGGIYVAIGDVNGDGREDLIVSSGPGRLADIEVISGADGSDLALFQPFGATTAGTTVAAADLDSDGFAEIIVGSGPGDDNEVGVFTGTGTPVFTFAPYPTSFNGRGVFVAAGRGVGVAGSPAVPLIATAPGKASSSTKVFTISLPLGDGTTATEVRTINAFPGSNPGGARVAFADLDQNGQPELLVAPGPGKRNAKTRAFSIVAGSGLGTIAPFASDGAQVAAGR